MLVAIKMSILRKSWHCDLAAKRRLRWSRISLQGVQAALVVLNFFAILLMVS